MISKIFITLLECFLSAIYYICLGIYIVFSTLKALWTIITDYFSKTFFLLISVFIYILVIIYNIPLMAKGSYTAILDCNNIINRKSA